MPSFSPAQRPHALQTAIDNTYTAIANKSISDWSVDCITGPYQLGNIDEYKVILALIQERLKSGERTFYLLDVGAGLFTWGRYLAVFLTEEFQKPDYLRYENINCHIVGVSGEAHGEEMPSKLEGWWGRRRFLETLEARNSIMQGIFEEDLNKRDSTTRVLKGNFCTIHEFGNVKIENIQEVLPERLRLSGATSLNQSHDLMDTFDFAIASSSLHHLIDGTGTLVQLLNMLKPNGIVHFQGFWTEIKTMQGQALAQSCKNILANLGLPFFISTAIEHHPTCFMQKNISGSLQLPLTYDDEASATLSSTEYPRAPMISLAGFRTDWEFERCNAINTERQICNLDGLHFYNTIVALAETLIEDTDEKNPWVVMAKNTKTYIFESLSTRFGADTVNEKSPLLNQLQHETSEQSQIYPSPR